MTPPQSDVTPDHQAQLHFTSVQKEDDITAPTVQGVQGVLEGEDIAAVPTVEGAYKVPTLNRDPPPPAQEARKQSSNF